MISDVILNSSEVKLAITLKTNQIKRESLKSITYQQVLETLEGLTWKHKYVKSIHNAVDDVMKLEVSNVVAYLSLNAIEKGSSLSLDDLHELLKGELYG